MRLRVSADPAGCCCCCCIWTLLGMMPTTPAWVLLFARDRLPTAAADDGPTAESARRRASPRLDVRDRGSVVIIGEMDPDRKHAMSHRAEAVKKLRAALLP